VGKVFSRIEMRLVLAALHKPWVNYEKLWSSYMQTQCARCNKNDLNSCFWYSVALSAKANKFRKIVNFSKYLLFA